MNPSTFFWHDYETFGRDPRRSRPAQFAGLRTDFELNEVGEPVMAYCHPPVDQLPDPESCLLTGITPQQCTQAGLPEHEFAALIQAQLAEPGTIGVGYNSIKFDDEVTRFLLWRNLIEPYAREWQNQCGRWDLLNVVRCVFAFHPDTLRYVTNAEGQPSLKLEHLAQANQLVLDQAHDALSDVRTTVALARLIRQQLPRLWDFCLSLRDKHKVLSEIGVGRPFLHVSGMYGVQRGCLAMVWPLAMHPHNKNEVILWDLAHDPSVLRGMSAADIRARLFVSREQLPEGAERLPIKTLHINQSPIVVSQLRTLKPELAQRWGMDVEQCLKHAQLLAQFELAGAVWSDVYQRPPSDLEVDVDEDLYGGFLGSDDRRMLDRCRDPSYSGRVAFSDPRLMELVFRYRARQSPQSLSEAELADWMAHCKARLGEPQAYLARLAELRAIDQGQAQTVILDALASHAQQLFTSAGI